MYRFPLKQATLILSALFTVFLCSAIPNSDAHAGVVGFRFLSPQGNADFQSGNFIRTRVRVSYEVGTPMISDPKVVLAAGTAPGAWGEILGDAVATYIGADPQDPQAYVIEYLYDWRVPSWENSFFRQAVAPGEAMTARIELFGGPVPYPASDWFSVTYLSKFSELPIPHRD